MIGGKCACGAAADYAAPKSDGTYEPFCWICKTRAGHTANGFVEVLAFGDEAFIDRGSASGACVCEACGKTYHEHPRHAPYPFMTKLCDNSLVKL